MIGVVLQSILSNNAAYAASMSDPSGGIRLYPKKAPQGTKRPYATYDIVSRIEDPNKEQRGFVTYMIQVNQYAKEITESQQLDSLCIAALDRYRGVVEGIDVNSIRVVTGGAGFEENLADMPSFSEFSIKINP